ncbi:hypothetical protein [uncultured Fibrobacter sp.]|uniref:hypothetical protein n=1 Tax=uncultured Fibrobacter sp. TaxID=261512 RepID=UPI0025F2B7A2|nr:hypothetical protein [uncultured Fibrobacter sp.]
MKKNIYVFLLMACMAWSSESIQVEVKDEQPHNASMLGLRLRIVNNSGRQYDNLHAKFYLKKRSSDNLILEKYYMGNLSAGIIVTDSVTAIIDVGIPSLRSGFTPDANGISLGLHRSDWSSLDKDSLLGESRDADFSEGVKYGVYFGDSLIAGNLSSMETENGPMKIRFVGIRPETADSVSPWVQIQNYGNTDISLSGFAIKDASGARYSLGGLTLGAKSSMRVCNGAVSACAYDSVITSISGLSFGKTGELVLYHDSVPLDYIAWGTRGVYADSLEIENNVFISDYFFNTSEEPNLGPTSIYRKGDFFRAVIMDGSDSIVSWSKFKEKMVASPFSQMPYAEPLAFSNERVVFKHSEEETVLAWIPVAGVKSYEVVVLNADDSSLVFHGFTDETRLSFQLDEGRYMWWAAPVDGKSGYSAVPGYIPWNQLIPLEYVCSAIVHRLDGSEIPLYDLHVDPLAARKDSYMLNLKWGEHIIEAGWDRPHNSTGYVDQFGNRRFRDINHYHPDAEESWRCAATGTAMVNHAYGGNLTQDEIKFYYMTQIENKDPILEAFPHSDEGGVFPNSVLAWALNLSEEEAHRTIGFPSDEIILQALNHGNPVVFWMGLHVMVIDAAVYDTKTNQYLFRFLNVDNDGTVDWTRAVYDSDTYYEYFIPEDPRTLGRNAKKSELYEDKNGNGLMDFDEIYDADEDGLLDFDEYYRFGTYHENLDYDVNGNGYLDFDEYRHFAAVAKDVNRDYDGDGIMDKIEIMSYTIREKYPEIVENRDYGVVIEKYSDIDGDGIRAEKDPDSDDDGRLDGQEDVNANGLKDNYETDVYVKDADQLVGKMPDIDEITLYALSRLNYNDGVVCYNDRMLSGRCAVASAGFAMNDGWAMNIGARADVGDVFSRGNVFLRSNTHVRGGVFLTNGSNINSIYLQNGVSIANGVKNWSYYEWDEKYYPQNYELENYTVPYGNELIVRDGDVGILNPGIYSSVKVEGGGLLYIFPGTTYIGSIQLDPRSNIMFLSPGRETVMHVNGEFTWRANTLNDASQYPYIAQGFKLLQHSKSIESMYIGTFVAGYIFAPYSDVIVAQARKLFYGRIFAKNISIHQYAKIYHVDFSPIQTGLVASMEGI